MGGMFSVTKVTTWILMLRGTRMRASAQNGRRKYTPDDREASYRGLVRDVILGSFTVFALSLAVPAWIIRVEYSKTDGRVPVGEVLRERTLETVTPTPRLPRVLELADQIGRREILRRESERHKADSRDTVERRDATDSPSTAKTDVPAHHVGQPAEALPPNSRHVDFRESAQAP